MWLVLEVGVCSKKQALAHNHRSWYIFHLIFQVQSTFYLPPDSQFPEI